MKKQLIFTFLFLSLITGIFSLLTPEAVSKEESEWFPFVLNKRLNLNIYIYFVVPTGIEIRSIFKNQPLTEKLKIIQLCSPSLSKFQSWYVASPHYPPKADSPQADNSS